MSFLDDKQQKLILHFVVGAISEDTFCRGFGLAPDEIATTGLTMLERALREHDAVAVSYGIGLLQKRPVDTETFVDVLLRAIEADWHISHEEIAFELGLLKSPRSVDALARTALKRFRNRGYDDFNSRARKCAFALEAVGTIEAVRALEGLMLKGNRILSREARARLNSLKKNGNSEDVRNQAHEILLAHRQSKRK